ncbi:GAF and ANTAR domain-containing protein [Subtercola boreus]|uniref:Transcriptional regulator n=1 Tax=Subtercola boreus TaxID=120213 RepID=A0A3E0W776_9MICO|nr:GAF and ANTAR domain-containing protein [Subtercola boreus]RFA17581.1 transcriptional regulator [Subtercola boreus]RFA17700.1 transcriptional regulator [Subtercola boreus]RFA24245.1 transcriptional regulator [Subtercola boreus]
MTENVERTLLVEALVTLADTLVAGYDIIDLLQTLVEKCADVLDAADVGIILANQGGTLETVAATNERSHLLDLMQLDAGQGPCVQAYLSGAVVSVPDLDDAVDRWPVFAMGARELGYGAVHSVPLRLRDDTLGALNVFRDRTGVLSSDDVVAARALADVATIGILQERAIRHADTAREQLQHALNSRVIIEQAKGIVSHTHNVNMDAAFQIIRRHTRNTNTSFAATATGIVNGTVTV